MFSYFAPSYVKQARAFLKDARKMRSFNRDLWKPEVLEEFSAGIEAVEKAVSARDKAQVEEAVRQLDALAGRIHPPHPDAGWRENCEVFLVAIVIALGVRTYFLQPFTIPTGSMQPTLNGIVGHPTKEEPPNILVRTFHAGAYGRSWIDAVATVDDEIEDLREEKRLKFFTSTVIVCKNSEYRVGCGRDVLVRSLLPEDWRTRRFKAGEVIARGYVDTGDHVFVDKMTYNFRAPRRDAVFVFSTSGISGLNAPGTPSQFYIKRLAGTPGDTLRIDPPNLYINGELAGEPGFRRVMQGTRLQSVNNYRGYGNGAEHKGWDQQFAVQPMNYLDTPQATFTLPPKTYWALGDNSFNSLDSRAWGTVPEKNVMGRAVFVYWPFGPHWGWIR